MLEAEARRQLAGVGDPALGEWAEWSGAVAHLRRRLSAREQARARLDVVDIRGTVEAVVRARALGDRIVHVPPDALAEELGDLAPMIGMRGQHR
jgi:hypothetical protein